MKVIIDASVAIKWFYKEINQENAIDLLAQIKNNNLRIVVPLLFFYEIGNVFRTKKEKQQTIQKAFSTLEKLHFDISDEDIYEFPEIYLFANQFEITFYDAIYAYTMKKHEYQFITADKKLYNKLKNEFSKVKLL